MRMKPLFSTVVAIGLAISLASCGEEAEAPVETAPEGPEGVIVSDGWMSLPAVAGNPAAVYFTIENSSEQDQMIRAADVLGADSAVLHQMGTWNLEESMDELLQLNVPAGESVAFEPGGYHVMAMNVSEGLEAGSQTEVTLTFVRGDKLSFPVDVRAPGDAPD